MGLNSRIISRITLNMMTQYGMFTRLPNISISILVITNKTNIKYVIKNFDAFYLIKINDIVTITTFCFATKKQKSGFKFIFTFITKYFHDILLLQYTFIKSTIVFCCRIMFSSNPNVFSFFILTLYIIFLSPYRFINF